MILDNNLIDVSEEGFAQDECTTSASTPCETLKGGLCQELETKPELKLNRCGKWHGWKERMLAYLLRTPSVTPRSGVRSCLARPVQRRHKIAIWVLMMFIIAVNPIVMSWSYKDNDGNIIKRKYNTGSVYVTHFFLSWILGQSITYVFYGYQGWRACYSWKTITLMAPVSMAYSVAEFLSLLGINGLSPVIYGMVQKTGLLQSTIISAVFLGRRIGLGQWLVSIQLSILVLAFIFRGETDPTMRLDMASLITELVAVSLTSAGGAYGDVMYKTINLPVPIQIVCGRATAVIWSLITSLAFAASQNFEYGFFGGPQGGWDYRVVVLVFFLAMRDWTITWVLKYLNVLWKCMGSACAVGILYLLEAAIERRAPDPTLTCIAAALMIAVFIRALVGSDKKEGVGGSAFRPAS